LDKIEHGDAIEIAKTLASSVASRADEADRKGELPDEDVDALKRSGYQSFTVPKQYGGPELSVRTCVEAQLELAKASGSTALVAGMTMQVVGNARDLEQWVESDWERLGNAACSGGLINSVASEKDMGSPSRGGQFQTTAVEQGDDYSIDGYKTWATGGRHLTHMLVRLTLNDDSAVILVEGDRPGVSWKNTWADALSLRASDSNDLTLDGVVVPKENLIAKKKANGRPMWFPMVLGATYLGVATAARDRLVQFTLERVPSALGKPIATLPKIQREIGEIDASLMAARALLFEVASEWDQRTYGRVAAAKQFATRTASEVTDHAIRVAGAQSLTTRLPLERYFRDTRAGTMAPPSGDTAYEFIGSEGIEHLRSRIEN
jgi:alkylation response protein AidB-like acyl-CoA dehydrogenase